MSEANILVGFEFSGIVRDAFITEGYNAVSCDLLPTEKPGPHIQGDIRSIQFDQFGMVILFPECTYLANSGVKHLYKEGKKVNGKDCMRWENMWEAAKMINWCMSLPIEKIAVENPIMHGHAKKIVGGHTQIIQPWQHGHKQMKATCLRLKNLPKLKVSNNVGPPPENKEERKKWQNVWLEPPSAERKKNRARTFEGIAKAMAQQWGKLL